MNAKVKQALYNCVLYHSHIVYLPIVNGFLKVSIDGNI